MVLLLWISLFPKQNKKDLVEGCMWLSLTFLVQDKEQKADKREERKKKKKIKQKRHCLWGDKWSIFLSAWDMTDVSCPWKESFLSSSFKFEINGCDGGDRLREREKGKCESGV